jgi:Cu+-exporting ATPase
MRAFILALPLILAACGKDEPPKASMPAAPATSTDRAKDPICGMMVDREKAPFKTAHEGATYYFCAESCLKKFQADPTPHAKLCACGKTSGKCPCEHCGGHRKDPCDCAK